MSTIASLYKEHNVKKYAYPVIGVIAFVVGGLIARDKTLDGLETLEKIFNRPEKTPSEDS